MNLNMLAADIFTQLEKNLSKKFDTEESWENNFKMSVKMVLAWAKGSALGLCCRNISENVNNFVLVVDIIAKKDKHEEFNKIEDNLVAKRLVIGIAVTVCQNQAGVTRATVKIIGSVSDPIAVGVQELPDEEMVNNAEKETDAES